MSGHTPGPWHIANSPRVSSLEVSAGDTAICELWRRADREKEQANARLIAAAPDLLASAKRAASLLWEIASEVEDGVRTLNEDSAEGVAWAALTDAIAKAEGKS